MGNMINIGGRIHNPEVGNVVTGANEIYDDTKQKKQNVINAETDASLLNLSQNKQDNLTFDNAPTENSTNPVTSGGVYAADAALQQAIEAILLLIPSAASALNQLADKAFVNSSIATNTATFRGTYNSVSDLHLAVDATHAQIEAALDSTIATADNNDYCYVQIPVSATSFDIEKTERYKFNGTGWKFEYQLNNSGFTAAQWAAINSGITDALVGDLNFIKSVVPAEATTINQLADKAYVLAQILAATPAFKGQFTTLADLQAVVSPNAGDLGIVRTKDSDGYDVFTFYQYLNNAWNVFYTLSHHPKTKPATTGTTGDYPYNGMGRVVIPKNMVGGVNTLTQAAFEDSEGNDIENTVFVVQYDFVLGENITLPLNCVLQFDGGSFDGSHVVSGGKMPTNVIYTPEMFGAGKTSDDTKAIQSCVNLAKNVRMDGTYNVYVSYRTTYNGHSYGDTIYVPSNTNIEVNGQINYLTTDVVDYNIFILRDVSNVNIHGNGKLQGDKLIHTGSEAGEWGDAIDIVGNSYDINIDGIECYNLWGDGIYTDYAFGESYNISISNVYVHDYRRNGISINRGHHVTIRDCKIERQDSVSYGSVVTSIDIERHTEAGNLSDILIENCDIDSNLKINVNTFATTLHRIYVKNVVSTLNLNLQCLNNDCIIEGCKAAVISIRETSDTTLTGNNPTIRNCKAGRIDARCGAEIRECEFGGIATSGAVNNQEECVFYNCLFTFACIDVNTTFRNYNLKTFIFYDCNLKFNASSTLMLLNSATFIRCVIDFYGYSFGYYVARDCEIILRQNVESEYCFYNIVTLFHCLIRIAGSNTLPIYRLNYPTGGPYQPLINEGSVVVCDVAHTKTYGTGGALYDAGTVYIANHQLAYI